MHLLNDRIVYISSEDISIINALTTLGIKVIESESVKELLLNEQRHADMQMLVINETAFIPENICSIKYIIEKYFNEIIVCNSLQKDYPDNISLNAALVGNYLFCKEDSLAKEVREYCTDNSIEIVNVKQGYTKCSTLIVSNNAIITADKGMHHQAKLKGIDSLLITPGYIHLKDANYGFIGGCSGKIGEYILFFGDIKYHPDSDIICDFISDKGCKYINLSDAQLNDIGGLVLIS